MGIDVNRIVRNAEAQKKEQAPAISRQAQIVVNNGAGRVNLPVGTDTSKLTKESVQKIVATSPVQAVQTTKAPLPAAIPITQPEVIPLSQRVKISQTQPTPAVPTAETNTGLKGAEWQRETLDQMMRSGQQDALPNHTGPTNNKNLNALLYGTERAAAGLLGFGEGITDFIGGGFYKGVEGITSLGGLLPNKVSEYAGKLAEGFVDNSITRDYEQSIKERYNPSQLQETATGIGQSVNNILAGIALGQGGGAVAEAVSGAGKLMDATKKAQTAANVGKAALGLSAAGSGAREAYEEGATTEKALAYGAAAGTLETLIEAVADGIPMLGKSKLTQVVQKLVKNPAVEKVLGTVGEGLEEAASTILTPFIKRAIYDKDAELASADEIAQSALLGMAVSGVLQLGIDLPQAIGNRAVKSALPQKTTEVRETDVSDAQNAREPMVETETETKVGFMGPEVDAESDPSAEAKAHMQNLTPDLLPKKVEHTKEWEEAAYQAKQAGERLGVKVEIVSDLPNGVEGEYRDGVIRISENAKNPLKATFVHELTHHLEATNTYSALSEYVLERTANGLAKDGKSIDEYRRQIKDAYAAKGKNIDDAAADKEIVANYIEQKLFNNSKEIAKLANTHRNLVQVIRDWFADLRVKFRGTAEEKELLRAQRLFEKALRETNVEGYRTSGDGQYSFAGENAITADLAALERAKQMQTAGADASAILRDTGWYVGRDGKWRFEIDDSNVSLDENGEARYRAEHPEYVRYMELMNKLLTGDWPTQAEFAEIKQIEAENPGIAGMRTTLKYNLEQGMATLGDYMLHDSLYKAYPQIAKTKVILSDSMASGKAGSYNPQTDTITLNKKLAENPDKLIGVILHEIQHKIQLEEGFTPGSSIAYWNREEPYEKALQTFRDNRQRLLNKISKEDRDLYNEYMEIDKKQEALLDDIFNLDLDEMGRLEERSDELYNLLYPKEWFKKIGLYDRILSNAKDAVESMYFYTSGEIEARDTANRMKLTADERRTQMPDLGDENTVFADGSGNAYSYIGKTKDGVPVYKSDFEDTVSEAKRKQLFESRIATIFNLGAVKLNTDTKKIEVLGDKFTFDKNLYGDDYATDKELSAKINALYDMADILSNSTFVGKNAENSYVNNVPPKNKAHKNVKYWYKFKNEIVLDGLRYDVVFNIRDKGKDQYAYLIEFREKETPANSNTATKNSLLRTKQVSLDSRVPQTKPSVKTSGQNSIEIEGDLLRASSGRTAEEVRADTKAAVEQYGAMRENKQPGVREATYPHETAQGKTMHTAQTIGGSNLVDDRMELNIEEAILDGKFAYEVSGDKEAIRSANEKIEGGNYEVLSEQAKGLFADGYRLKKDQVVFVERMIQEATKKGDVDTAMSLIADLAAYGTEQGQNIQALSMIRRMTPEGKLMVLKRQVDKANQITQVDSESKGEIKKAEREIKEIKREAFSGLEDIGVDEDMDIETAQRTVDEAIADETAKASQSGLPTAKKQQLQQKKQKLSEAEKKIRELEKTAKKLKNSVELPKETVEAMLKAKSPSEQNDLYNKALDEIASQIVSSLPDKVNAWRYLAMLGNPRTHIRNMTGNATMYVTNAAKNIVKYGIESLPGVKRTTALKASKEAKAFAKEDFELNRDLITGGGKMNASDELRDRMTIFKNKGLEAFRKFNTAAMKAEDEFFMRKAYESSLARYITANKKSKAFLESGSTAAESFLAKAREYAIKEAREVTFHDDSAVADWLSGITRTAKDEKASTKVAKAMVEGVLPFKKTPINVAKRGIEYSPVSIATAINKFAKGDAAGGVNDLAKGATGTIMMAVGLALAHFGMLRTKNEEKDEVLDTQENEQNYSLRIPNEDGTVTSVSLDALMPAAMPLLVGVEVNKLAKEEGMSVMSVLESLTGIADPIVENSMLDGLNDMLTYVGYSDNALGAIFADMGESYLEQFRPSILRQVQQSIDPTVRTTYTPKDSPIGKGVETHLRSLTNATPVLPWAAEKLDEATGSDRFSLQPKIDVWGNEVKKADSFGARLVQNMVLPFNVKKVTSDPVNEELRRLYHVDSTYSVLPKAADKSYEYKNDRYYPTPTEYTELAKEKGQTSKEFLNKTIKDAGYKALPDAKKADVVSNLLMYANYKAKQDFFDGRGINYVTDTFNGVEKAVARGLTAEEYYIMKAQMDGGQTAEEKIPYYMDMLTNDQKQFISRLPKDAASASWLERIALSNQGESAKVTSAFDDILIGEKKEKVDYSDKASVYLSLIDSGASSKIGDKYYEIAQPAGVSVEDYMVAYFAQRDVTYPAKTKGAKAAAEKEAIDKALPNLSKKQREALYQAFKG